MFDHILFKATKTIQGQPHLEPWENALVVPVCFFLYILLDMGVSSGNTA